MRARITSANRAEYGKQKRDNYTANDYHKPSDEVKPDWDLSGAVDDLRVFLEIGYKVAQARTFPNGSRVLNSKQNATQ